MPNAPPSPGPAVLNAPKKRRRTLKCESKAGLRGQGQSRSRRAALLNFSLRGKKKGWHCRNFQSLLSFFWFPTLSIDTFPRSDDFTFVWFSSPSDLLFPVFCPTAPTTSKAQACIWTFYFPPLFYSFEPFAFPSLQPAAEKTKTIFLCQLYKFEGKTKRKHLY